MTDDHLTPNQRDLLTDDLVLKVVTVLARYRDHDPCTSDALAAFLLVKDGPTHPVIRAAIGEAIRRGLDPICAGSTGYFTADAEDQVSSYAKELRGRAEATMARANNVERAWNVRQGQAVTAAADGDRRFRWVPEPEEM